MFNWFKKHEKITKVDSRLQSVGVIMDGNGRWAKKRFLPRTAGHSAGAKIIQGILQHFKDLGVHHITLYAFSTENWKRPKEEVDSLMELIYKYLDEVVIKELKAKDDFCVKFLGDESVLSKKLHNKCIEVEEMATDKPFIVNIALNYGGRPEIVHAVNEAIKEGKTEISEEDIQKHLYTKASPDPDLIIRTGGDYRLSNFLTWQSAYSEIYITKTLWPDFSNEEVDKAIKEFYSRKRRFGGLDPDSKK